VIHAFSLNIYVKLIQHINTFVIILYCVGDPFSEIENEFLNFSTNYNYICPLGDFNARTAEEPDFVETNYDEFL
jgi:hypothetical protein